MSDRLDELQRQRALLQTHLTWLDQEIAAARQPPGTRLPPPTPTPTPSPVTADEADKLISRYGSNPQDSVNSVKKGCYTIFALAFLLVGLVVLGFYLFRLYRLEG